MDDYSLPLAKEALAFKVVAINDTFNLPVGYFLIDRLNATERASLVQQRIIQLHNVVI